MEIKMYKFNRIQRLLPYVFSIVNSLKMVSETLFGEGGNTYVSFALVENEQRIKQAMKGIKKVLNR
jgi:hypothetical protein